MKPSFISPLVLLTVAANTAGAASVPITWGDSTGHTAWNSNLSWTSGAPPTDDIVTDAAIFTGVANAQPNLDVATRSVTGIDFQLPSGGAAFTSIPGATLTLGADGIDATTQLSGASSVGVETLRLGEASTWTLFSNTSSASISSFSITSNIELNGKNLSVSSNRSSTGGNAGVVNLSGAISGNASTKFQGASGSTNTIHLTGNNSYAGTTTITMATVTANSLANAGSSSAFGSSGTIIFGDNSSFANLTFQNLSVDGTTDRLLSLKGTSGYTLRNNDADNTISFTNAGNSGDLSISTASNLGFTLAGTNTGTNVFGQVINNRGGTGVTNFTKSEAGTWALTGDNTYTGTTTISGGTLRIGNGGTTGSLNPASPITNNAILAFHRSDNIVQGTHFSPAAIGGTGGLRKLGVGDLALNAANNFTGDKTIDRGSVSISGDQVASTGSWLLRGNSDSGSTNNNAATTVTFASDSSVAIAATKKIQLGSNAPAGGFHAQTLNANGTVANAGALEIGRVGILNLAGTWSQSGNVTVMSQGGGTANLNILPGGTFTYASANPFSLASSGSNNTPTNLAINGGSFTTSVKFRNTTATGGSNSVARVTLSDGGTLKLSADIPDLFTTAGAVTGFRVGTGDGKVDTNGFSATLNVEIDGTGGFTKAGTGTLTTTGINTYTGNTTVSGGTLSVAGADFADDSSVTIATGATLNLNFSGTDTVGSLTIGSNPPLADGIYSSATHPGFISGSGTLTVIKPANGFGDWATDLGLTGDPDADFDKDVIADAVEYILGTNPKAPNNTGISAQKSGTNLVFTFNRSDDSETSDIALSVEAGATLATWPQAFNIGSTTATSSAGVVVTENDDAPDTVTVTIPAGASTTLFARIKVGVTL
jgi:fibronectin-binding autotransporter adhesin